jgi:hypothetical protein
MPETRGWSCYRQQVAGGCEPERCSSPSLGVLGENKVWGVFEQPEFGGNEQEAAAVGSAADGLSSGGCARCLKEGARAPEFGRLGSGGGA